MSPTAPLKYGLGDTLPGTVTKEDMPSGFFVGLRKALGFGPILSGFVSGCLDTEICYKYHIDVTTIFLEKKSTLVGYEHTTHYVHVNICTVGNPRVCSIYIIFPFNFFYFFFWCKFHSPRGLYSKIDLIKFYTLVPRPVPPWNQSCPMHLKRRGTQVPTWNRLFFPFNY